MRLNALLLGAILAALLALVVVQSGVGNSVVYRYYNADNLTDYGSAQARGCEPMNPTSPFVLRVLRCPFWITP